jgi:hypothetical protein
MRLWRRPVSVISKRWHILRMLFSWRVGMVMHLMRVTIEVMEGRKGGVDVQGSGWGLSIEVLDV